MSTNASEITTHRLVAQRLAQAYHKLNIKIKIWPWVPIIKCRFVEYVSMSWRHRFAKQSFCIQFQAPDLGSVYIRWRIAS